MQNELKSQNEELSINEVKLKFKRGPNRRQNSDNKPPYITEEGLVLVDRRSSIDRRGASQDATTGNR